MWRVGLYGGLGGGLAAVLVHCAATQHPGIAVSMLAAFLAGVAFSYTDATPSNANPPSNRGHSVSDDIHALEKRGSRWTMVAMVLLCVAVDLSGAFIANANGLLQEIGAIHRWLDAISGWQATNMTPPASSHPSILPVRPVRVHLDAARATTLVGMCDALSAPAD
ncbi:hypothetical protein [Burkholderia ambifaria]|uniref:hypothetical protein n=1 Tax=Burkholderia ambifaria TaxID=152480 RepID=UPI0012FDD442|nr:hypothetical protein [Burkholderia ambifaria]